MYRQNLGTAIGTKFTPGCANLFMASLEVRMLECFEVRPWVYYMYIDDVFIIWTHEEEKLASFVEYMYIYH